MHSLTFWIAVSLQEVLFIGIYVGTIGKALKKIALFSSGISDGIFVL